MVLRESGLTGMTRLMGRREDGFGGMVGTDQWRVEGSAGSWEPTDCSASITAAPTIPVNPTSLSGGGGQRLHCPRCLLALSLCPFGLSGQGHGTFRRAGSHFLQPHLQVQYSASAFPAPASFASPYTVLRRVEANRIFARVPRLRVRLPRIPVCRLGRLHHPTRNSNGNHKSRPTAGR